MSTLTSADLHVKRSSTRLHKPPGGASILSFGPGGLGTSEPALETIDERKLTSSSSNRQSVGEYSKHGSNNNYYPDHIQSVGYDIHREQHLRPAFTPIQASPFVNIPHPPTASSFKLSFSQPPLTSSKRDQTWEKKRRQWLAKQKQALLQSHILPNPQPAINEGNRYINSIPPPATPYEASAKPPTQTLHFQQNNFQPVHVYNQPNQQMLETSCPSPLSKFMQQQQNQPLYQNTADHSPPTSGYPNAESYTRNIESSSANIMNVDYLSHHHPPFHRPGSRQSLVSSAGSVVRNTYNCNPSDSMGTINPPGRSIGTSHSNMLNPPHADNNILPAGSRRSTPYSPRALSSNISASSKSRRQPPGGYSNWNPYTG